jgi:streptomycin 6-kinase
MSRGRMGLVDAFPIPANLRDGLTRYADAEGSVWLAGLPAAVAAVAERWALEVEAPFEPGGYTAWVAPVRTADGEGGLVLKMARPHPEGRDEAEALRLWAGDGAVRVVDADAGHGALLLERCRPGTLLSRHPEPEQDAVLAALLPRLWVTPPPGHPFRPLSDMCDQWAGEFEARGIPAGLDPGLARAGIARLRELPRTAGPQVLLVTDLHAGNVLAAEREPWLAIDPKPYVGDRAYDVVQHLLNCRARLETAPVATAAGLAARLDLDPARVRAWLLARCVQMAHSWPWTGAVAARLDR